MKSLNLSWSDVRYGGLKAVCETVESALAEAGVDFYYLVGAQARDLWYALERTESRITRDVDFAILVTDTAQYGEVKALLKKSHGFDDSKGNAFSMRSPDGSTVDILPYGGIEEDDKVIAGGQGLTSIQVNGFKEVARAGTTKVLFDETRSTFRLATLPAIVLLKLIAYDDRPEMRGKDATDIMHIISTFFNLQPDLFYDVHYDLLGDIDLGYERIAARVIGREMQPILLESASLNARVRSILTVHIANAANNPFIGIMARSAGISPEEIVSVLASLQQGLDDELPSTGQEIE